MPGRDGTRLWVALLTAASAATTLALACATPFASLAAIAATRMPARAGVVLMALTWAVSQLIGFGLLDYPRDPTTIAWGIAMLTAALVALAAARWGVRAVAGNGEAVRVATAFGMGFISYKVTDFTGWGFSDEEKATLRRDGRIEQPSPYSDQPTVTTLGFWEAGEALKLLDGGIAIDCPVRLIHGQRDPDVPWEHTLRLAELIRSDDVQTILIKDGDHRLSRDADIATLIATIEMLP